MARRQAIGLAAKPERTRSSLKQISSNGIVTGAPRMPIWTIVPPRVTVSSAGCDRGLGAGALDDDVRGIARERPVGRRGLEAEAAGELEPRLVVRRPAHVHAPAVGARDLGGEQADRARADHEHLVAGIDARGVGERVADAGERLADRRRAIAQPVRHAVQVARRHADARRERAVDVRADRAALGQMLGRPERHQRQSPQVEKNVSEVTRAPAQAGPRRLRARPRRRRARGPIVTGGTHGYSPASMCRSVPQMPAASRSMTTSPGAGDGLRALGVGDVPGPGASLATPFMRRQACSGRRRRGRSGSRSREVAELRPRRRPRPCASPARAAPRSCRRPLRARSARRRARSGSPPRAARAGCGASAARPGTPNAAAACAALSHSPTPPQTQASVWWMWAARARSRCPKPHAVASISPVAIGIGPRAASCAWPSMSSGTSGSSNHQMSCGAKASAALIASATLRVGVVGVEREPPGRAERLARRRDARLVLVQRKPADLHLVVGEAARALARDLVADVLERIAGAVVAAAGVGRHRAAGRAEEVLAAGLRWSGRGDPRARCRAR